MRVTGIVAKEKEAFEKLNLGQFPPPTDQTQHKKESTSDSNKVYFKIAIKK